MSIFIHVPEDLAEHKPIRVLSPFLTKANAPRTSTVESKRRDSAGRAPPKKPEVEQKTKLAYTFVPYMDEDDMAEY